MQQIAERNDRAGGEIQAENACGGRWSLAVFEPSRLRQRGRYTVAILGHPYWRDDGLEDRRRVSGAAEAFIEALNRFGDQAPAETHGAFAAAWADEETGTLSLAIDRAGIQELYWRRLGDGTMAAANRCDLAGAAGGEAPAIDPVSLYNYLFYYCVPSPGTIFRTTNRLLPAEKLRFGENGTVSTKYWRMPYEQAAIRDPAEWHHALRETLSRAVARARENTEGTSGAFLSGGLDSSTIAGMLAELQPWTKTVTIRFHEPGYDEGAYARLAAERFATEHHERYVLPEEVEPMMDRFAEVCDQPYGNTSAVAAYYCALAGREAGVETMIAGDGGDELFAGNERYLNVRRYDIYARIPPALRRYFFDPLLAPTVLDRFPILRKAHRLRRRYAMSLPERMFAEYHPFQTFRLDEVVSGELLSAMRVHDPVAVAEEAFNAAQGGDDLQAMMATDLKLTIADNDLVKVNRACALAGVEVRYPMLDTELMELAAQIPSDQMLAGGGLRGLFKDAMEDFLPEEILRKPKQGFGLPFKKWVGEHPSLREKVSDLLADLRGRGIFTDHYIDALQAACRSREETKLRGNAWDAAMLELWLQSHKQSL